VNAMAVSAALLADIQGWAPGGGTVRSEWRAGPDLKVGDLIRRHGAWAVIVLTGASTMYGATGRILSKSPAITWQDCEGAIRHVEVLHADMGAEVRTDTAIDPDTIPMAPYSGEPLKPGAEYEFQYQIGGVHQQPRMARMGYLWPGAGTTLTFHAGNPAVAPGLLAVTQYIDRETITHIRQVHCDQERRYIDREAMDPL
jgi:hypothetical protein